VREIGGETADIRAILELERSSFFEYGDIITFSAALEETREEEAFLRAEKIFVRAVADDAVRTGEEKTGILHRISVVNQNMAERMVNLMGRDAGGFCAAIILGNKSYVDSEIKLNFSRAGISHLLALSGLHLSVLAGALDMILRGFTKKKTRGIILIISCFAFAIFTGLSASVLRASVMLAFVFAADIFGEENDSLTALFAAVWVILIFSGSAVYDVGFQLSAAATLGIIIVRPACDALFAKWKRPRKNKLLGAIRAVVKYFYGIFTMSAAAIIFTLPIIGYTFGEISLAGLWANFLFLPLASVLIVICTLLVPISYVPVLDAALAWACKLTSEAMISLAASVSDIRGISLSLRYPFVPYLLAVLALALVVCIFIKRLSLLKIGAGVLALVLSFAVCFGAYSGITSGDMTVRIGSDRSGEYVAFAADGESYIVDISTGGTEFVRDALESRKLFCETEIDNFIMTHYHDHHAGAIFRLCESVKIRRVILPVPETDGEEADLAYISETLSAKGIEMVLYTRGEAFENGEVKIAFAPMQKISRSEKPLVAFTLEYAEWSFSYIEGAALESSFDYSEHLSSQTVFVGAHGAARKFTASAEAFSGASCVIFAEGAMEYFRGTEYLAEAYDIGAYGGEMTILYDN
jgi:competence protein ComEC